jgi:hypothetical protein
LVPVTATTLVKTCDKWMETWICHQTGPDSWDCTLERICVGNEGFQLQTSTFCGLDAVALGTH